VLGLSFVVNVVGFSFGGFALLSSLWHLLWLRFRGEVLLSGKMTFRCPVCVSFRTVQFRNDRSCLILDVRCVMKRFSLGTFVCVSFRTVPLSIMSPLAVPGDGCFDVFIECFTGSTSNLNAFLRSPIHPVVIASFVDFI